MSRIKQFFLCITAKIDDNDRKFINKYLNNNEKDILYKLQISDIKHSVNVAKDIEKNKDNIDKDININEFIKLALLHDVGKQYRSLNAIDKSLLVLLNSASRGKLRRLQDKNKKVYIFYNHGEEGYKLLNHYDYDKEFIDTIRYHHIEDDRYKLIKELKKYDDRN